MLVDLQLMVVVLQVRGTCELDTRAQQVAEEAGSLNSDDVFVLETPAKTYLWIGKVRFRGNATKQLCDYIFSFYLFDEGV